MNSSDDDDLCLDGRQQRNRSMENILGLRDDDSMSTAGCAELLVVAFAADAMLLNLDDAGLDTYQQLMSLTSVSLQELYATGRRSLIHSLEEQARQRRTAKVSTVTNGDPAGYLRVRVLNSKTVQPRHQRHKVQSDLGSRSSSRLVVRVSFILLAFCTCNMTTINPIRLPVALAAAALCLSCATSHAFISSPVPTQQVTKQDPTTSTQLQFFDFGKKSEPEPQPKEEKEKQDSSDEYEPDIAERIFTTFFGKPEDEPFGLKRFGSERFPEQYPATDLP